MTILPPVLPVRLLTKSDRQSQRPGWFDLGLSQALDHMTVVFDLQLAALAEHSWLEKPYYFKVKKKGLRRDPKEYLNQNAEGAVAPTYSSTAAAGLR